MAEGNFTYNQLPASLEFSSWDQALIEAKVANPFYGLIQNPTSVYAQPTIQANYLLDAYPQYQSVNAFRVPEANSNYQSFIASAQHRYPERPAIRCFDQLHSQRKLLDDASQVVTVTKALPARSRISTATSATNRYPRRTCRSAL